MPVRDIASALSQIGARDFSGWVVDRRNPHRILVVEIIIDGHVFCTVQADQQAPCETPDRQESDGHHFIVRLPEDALRDALRVETRLANLGMPVGAPIRLGQAFKATPSQRDLGEVKWLGGLHVSGWCRAPDAAPLSVLIDGVLIEHVQPAAWKHVELDPRSSIAVRRFDVHLPTVFADGFVHRCAVLTARNDELAGSPFAFVAFRDGLRDATLGTGVSERDLIRADLFDRLVPLSVPFSHYEAWRTPGLGEAGAPAAGVCAVVLVGEGAAGDTLESLAAQTHAEWLALALPKTAGPTSFEGAALEQIMAGEARDCSVFVFALAGTVLHASALQRFMRAFASNDDVIAVYPDVNIQTEDGSVWPLAFPAFDYERMLEQGYCTLLFALTRSAVLRSLTAGAADLQRMFSAVLDDPAAAGSILHCPGSAATLPRFNPAAHVRALSNSSLAHLQRRALTARIEPTGPGVFAAVRLARVHTDPRTTIIIPTRNRRDLLEACIDSIMPAVRRHAADILILDNDSTDPDTIRYLRRLQGRGVETISVPGPFNFARLVNRGVAEAAGDLVCLLNNDVTALDADWLDEMLGRMADETVGVVAPLLVWPTGVVQHGGLVLGPKFEVAHAFTDRFESDPGYGDLLRVAHECSAVTAACLLTRTDDFHAVGGMDETRFPIDFNDVDYCLKLRQTGKRVVFTPHAKLIHAESSSRGSFWSADRRALFNRERRSLQLKWGRALVADPFYSPMLTLDPQPYSGLSAHSGPLEARTHVIPVASEIPDGF